MAELLVVLGILATLALALVPLLGTTTADAKRAATAATMTELRTLVLGTYRADMDRRLPRPGYQGVVVDHRHDRPQLRYLFVNPGSPAATDPVAETAVPSFDPTYRRGWRGPYLMSTGAAYAVTGSFTQDYGEAGDPTVVDGWGRPVVIFESADRTHAWLWSAGPDGALDPAGPMAAAADDLVLQLY